MLLSINRSRNRHIFTCCYRPFATTVQKEYSSKIYLWVLTANCWCTLHYCRTRSCRLFFQSLNWALKIQLQQSAFSPTGFPRRNHAFLVPVTIVQIIELITSKTKQSRIVHGVATVILMIGVAAHFRHASGKPGQPVFAPFSLSWSVAVDTLKQAKQHSLVWTRVV